MAKRAHAWAALRAPGINVFSTAVRDSSVSQLEIATIVRAKAHGGQGGGAVQGCNTNSEEQQTKCSWGGEHCGVIIANGSNWWLTVVVRFLPADTPD